VGTLGAGNHFIEVDVVRDIYDEEAARRYGLFAGQIAIQIHCGSRGLGHQVCTDYVQRFQQAVQKYGIRLPDRELVCAPLNSPDGQAYLAAMKAAANYAFANRQVLAHHVRRAFEEALSGKVRNPYVFQVYDVGHNMAKIEQHEVDESGLQSAYTVRVPHALLGLSIPISLLPIRTWGSLSWCLARWALLAGCCVVRRRPCVKP
jgi:tRNA-splicing ligase RtcB